MPGAGDIDQVIVPGGLGVNEVAFLHRSTSTLVLTDLIQNFEPEKVSPLVRPLVRFAGAMAPDGKAPVHLRFAINRKETRPQQRPESSWAGRRSASSSPMDVGSTAMEQRNSGARCDGLQTDTTAQLE